MQSSTHSMQYVVFTRKVSLFLDISVAVIKKNVGKHQSHVFVTE